MGNSMIQTHHTLLIHRNWVRSVAFVLPLLLLNLGALAKDTISIKGTILFTKNAPVQVSMNTSSDAACKSQTMQKVVVHKGKLQGVHVRIKNGTAGKHKAPSKPLIIVQKGCAYLPHMAGAMQGQAVAIKNQDLTMHNVHAYVGRETWFNRSQPKGAPPIVERDIGEAGEVFELKCNVHSWMHSYIPITDHPFFDVSNKEGGFTIKNLPTGTYILEAWHPVLGKKTHSVTISKGSTKVDFSFP